MKTEKSIFSINLFPPGLPWKQHRISYLLLPAVRSCLGFPQRFCLGLPWNYHLPQTAAWLKHKSLCPFSPLVFLMFLFLFPLFNVFSPSCTVWRLFPHCLSLGNTLEGCSSACVLHLGASELKHESSGPQCRHLQWSCTIVLVHPYMGGG